MKKATVLLVAMALVLAYAPAYAGGDKAGKKHEVTAEIVSVDQDAKTITIKTEDGKTTTAPVMGEAVGQLKELQAGQKVTVTCKDKENGDHEGVTAIKKVS